MCFDKKRADPHDNVAASIDISNAKDIIPHAIRE